MAPPIITLTTDFGLSDHYVGAMKGVMLGICRDARIVDISHDVAPFAISEAAYAIAQAWRYFPAGTVHVIVVDPGVGSARRPILAEAGGHYFIAPDNGVLGLVYAAGPHTVRVIEQERYFLHPVSRTFHGRDVFAPSAAHLAAGESPSGFGSVFTEYVRPAFARAAKIGEGCWRGSVLKIDRFGNVITNFRASDFPGLERRPFSLSLASAEVKAFATHYAERGKGELFVIAGSSGFLEISMAQASAAQATASKAEDAIDLRVPENPRAL
jgi:S-adenosyl-L-methionine hydrolase (adenosine-forming)